MKVDFRNAYKSDFLGSIDLEAMIEDGTQLLFTITKVEHGNKNVAGKKGIFNVAFFAEDIKPLVLNSGNAKIVRKLSKSKSVNPDEWNYPITVELYVDENVRFGADTVSGIRIKEFSTLVKTVKVDTTNAIATLQASTTLAELQENWTKLSKQEQAQPIVVAKKDELKTTLK